MTTYSFLNKYFNKTISQILICIWYILLILLVYILSDSDPAGFRYLGL